MSQKNAHRPVIAVTSGEPAGIGPDICLALASQAAALSCRPVILADSRLLAERAKMLGLPITFCSYAPENAPPAGKNMLEILHQPLHAPCQPGKLNPANSPYVLSLLDRAIDGCLNGEFAALVTAPLHKGVIDEAIDNAPHFTGHTEYLAEKTGAKQAVMMLAGESGNAHTDGMLRVALATTHLPLKEIPLSITPESLEGIIETLMGELRKKYGFAAPRLLVAGLNPHAGEGGHMGDEEIRIITPTLEKLRQEKGYALIGPLPADTLFTPPLLATGDAVLAMYHDQGLAPLKYATFGHGVNITLGLPIIRTSVDHGTALTLAGSGKAKTGSLLAALCEAVRQVGHQQEKPPG